MDRADRAFIEDKFAQASSQAAKASVAVAEKVGRLEDQLHALSTPHASVLVASIGPDVSLHGQGELLWKASLPTGLAKESALAKLASWAAQSHPGWQVTAVWSEPVGSVATTKVLFTSRGLDQATPFSNPFEEGARIVSRVALPGTTAPKPLEKEEDAALTAAYKRHMAGRTARDDDGILKPEEVSAIFAAAGYSFPEESLKAYRGRIEDPTIEKIEGKFKLVKAHADRLARQPAKTPKDKK